MTNWWRLILLLIFILIFTFASLFFTLKEKKKSCFLGVVLGVAIGAIAILFILDLLPETLKFSNGQAWWIIFIIFGFALNYFIDLALPHFAASHQKNCLKRECHCDCDKPKNFEFLEHTAIMTGISFASHNLTEGLFFGALVATNFAASIVVAIAIILHNLPLSLAIVMSEFFATQSRKQAAKILFWSVLPFILTSIGSFLLVQNQALPKFLMLISLSVTLGMLIYTTKNELWPMAKKYAGNKLVWPSIIAGALVMLSLHYFLRT